MPLQQSVTIGYWAVQNPYVSNTSSQARATLAGWLTKADADANKPPVVTRPYTVAGKAFAALEAEFAAGQTNVYTLAESYIIASDPLFSGANQT